MAGIAETVQITTQLGKPLRCWRISRRLGATSYSAAGRVRKRSADELLITALPLNQQLRSP